MTKDYYISVDAHIMWTVHVAAQSDGRDKDRLVHLLRAAKTH